MSGNNSMGINNNHGMSMNNNHSTSMNNNHSTSMNGDNSMSIRNGIENTDRQLILHPIAHVESDFPEKFGIPRQSGLVWELKARIVFEPEYRIEEAVRGLEEFSHIWLIWEFSEVVRERWSPTVRPPRLGGNVRKGVFATRSPFRPNPLGLSCVKLDRIERSEKEGMVLHVSGADLMDGTPIYDIKPYIPYADSHPEASGSFADSHREDCLKVEIPEKWLHIIPEEHREAVRGILAQDPRPAYQNNPERIYGFSYGGMEIRFRVEEETAIVCEIDR